MMQSESTPESVPTPRPRRSSWPFTWRFDTPAEITHAIRVGAGVAAFLAAAQIVAILTNAYGDGSVDGGYDALLYGIAAWFLVTKRSRIAAFVALGNYVAGQILLVVQTTTVWGVDARPGWLSVFIIAALVQAFRATIHAHRARVGSAPPILTTEP
jgi:hypothetical protein